MLQKSLLCIILAFQACMPCAGRRALGSGQALAHAQVMSHFPGDHAAVLAGFAAAPERQFRFLRGALQARARAFCDT